MTDIDRKFYSIVAASLASAVIGGLFGAGIALLSPSFVSDLFLKEASKGMLRYGAAAGAISGIVLGAAVMTLIIMATILAEGIRNKKRDQAQ